MQAFIVSLIAGLLFPLVLPFGTELGAINEIHVDTWAITGTVYAAAMGLVSRNQAIAFAGLFFTAACAVIYGVAKSVGEGHGDIYFLRFGSHCRPVKRAVSADKGMILKAILAI
jgi:hypothetical protein